MKLNQDHSIFEFVKPKADNNDLEVEKCLQGRR